MAFADDFRETAVPMLRDAAKAQSLFVALGLADLEEARNAVADRARVAGSALLRQRDQDRLADWIANLIWREVEAAHERVALLNQRADMAAAVDPVRYYDGLASRCSEPEKIRWAFAAIDARYRKHLQGGKANGR